MIIIKINYASTLPNVNITYDNSVIYAKVVYGNGGGGAATWGLINGTLSNQTDLQNALDAKVPYSGATANVNLGEYEMKAGQMTLDTSPTGTAAVGTTRWNDTIGSSETTLKGGSVILKNGVDLVARVVNKVSPNTTLTKASYQAVRISGAQGQRLAVELAQANNDNNSADTIGLVTETISPNQEGFIMTVGSLESINTTGSLQGETWTDGDVLYLSPTTPGVITNVKPIAPQHLVVIGYVEYAHQNNGKIYVKVMNGWELGELHDVNTTGATNGQVLSYNSTSGIWEPTTNGSGTVTSVAVSGGTGISVSGSPITSSGTITVTNSAPDQVVNLTGAGTTTTSGTYPNFTITSNDQFVGTVTSVGLTSATTGVTIGSSPITTSGNISLTIATASGSQNGLLSSTDWTTFNNKQNALTNPITGTGTSGQVAYWSGTNTQTGSNNLFWDNANGRLGIGTNVPANSLDVNNGKVRFINSSTQEFDLSGQTNLSRMSINNTWFFLGTLASHPLVFGTASNERLRIFANGNVGIGTGSTDSGQRLQVTGDTLLKGSGNTSATTALTVQNSAGSNLLRLLNDSTLKLGNENIDIIPTGNGSTASVNGRGLIISTNAGSQSGVGALKVVGNYTSTISNDYGIWISHTFINGTAGVATHSGLLLNQTINQTGGANGITRGLYVNPTLTAAADWRSIEWSNNSGWGLYGAGTANNYMAGSLGIGTTTLTSGRLNIAGSGIDRAINIGFTFSGATTRYGILQYNTINSDVTSTANNYYSQFATQAASFTLTNVRHYITADIALGLGSSVTNQVAYYASTLQSATNNFGFQGDLTAATGCWNIYMSGTASNYLEGDTAIGTTSLGTATKLTLGGSETAVSAIARGGLINTTLVASANNDVLVGLDINPTFTNGAFTGVANVGLRVLKPTGSGFLAAFGSSIVSTSAKGVTISENSNGTGLITAYNYDVAAPSATVIASSAVFGFNGSPTNFYGIGIGELRSSKYDIWFQTGASNGGGYRFYRSTTELFTIFENGNVGVGTGSTNAGYRLDVNGTARVQGDFTLSDTRNIILGTTTGTKIGTATSQKLAFWNATPIVQPTTAIAEATFVENSGGTAVNVDSTFAGYTLQQIAQALKNMGILA
jgi:hypothetical protein